METHSAEDKYLLAYKKAQWQQYHPCKELMSAFRFLQTLNSAISNRQKANIMWLPEKRHHYWQLWFCINHLLAVNAIAVLVQHERQSSAKFRKLNRLLRLFSLQIFLLGIEHDAHLLNRTSNPFWFLASTLCPLTCARSAVFFSPTLLALMIRGLE